MDVINSEIIEMLPRCPRINHLKTQLDIFISDSIYPEKFTAISYRTTETLKKENKSFAFKK